MRPVGQPPLGERCRNSSQSVSTRERWRCCGLRQRDAESDITGMQWEAVSRHYGVGVLGERPQAIDRIGQGDGLERCFAVASMNGGQALSAESERSRPRHHRDSARSASKAPSTCRPTGSPRGGTCSAAGRVPRPSASTPARARRTRRAARCSRGSRPVRRGMGTSRSGTMTSLPAFTCLRNSPSQALSAATFVAMLT